MSKLVKHVKNCLKKTDKYESNLNEEILKMEGMTGTKTRHLYNNICSMVKAKYLEIGSWKGSSTCSALYNNKVTCLCIDNWSQFGGPKEEFINNFNKYKGSNDATFLERNCWDIRTSSIGRFNIYMYDGEHTEESQYNALVKYFTALDDEFIYIADDWSLEAVQVGTLKAIEYLNLTIEFEYKNSIKDDDWNNGIGIFILKKQQPEQVEFKSSNDEESNYI